MKFHDLKLIFGNLKKAGKSTFFNLVGLSVSFAAFMLLSIYLHNEFTYDSHNSNFENMYVLRMNIETQGESNVSMHLPMPMADLILESTPETENLCSFKWGPSNYTKDGEPNKVYKIVTGEVDSSFTDIFTIKIKSGSQKPLREANHIIISEKTAQQLFGNEDPIGKVIMGDLKNPYVVEAVFYNLPPNSSFKYDAYCAIPKDNWAHTDWAEYSFNHMFLLNKDVNLNNLSNKISEIPRIKSILDEYADYNISFDFLPFKEFHFYPEGGKGNKTFVNAMVIVSILVLLMAFINFINFGIANVPKLARSINMRRVLGEKKGRLHFILRIEALLLMLLAFGIGLAVSYTVLFIWPDLYGYSVLLIDYINIVTFCLLLFVLLGVSCANIPARFILKAKPIEAIKGNLTHSVKNSYSGKILTVVQYSISILLIIGVLFLQKQISFLRNYDLGFEKENILVIETTKDIRNQETAFAEELIKNPNVMDYAYSQFVPGGVGMGWGRQIEGKQVHFKCWPVDEKYLDFMGFEVVDGRSFSKNIEADENNFVFNQKALKKFEWTENYLGKIIPGFDFEGKLIGVVKDMKYASLHEEIEPMAFWLTKTRHNKLSLKIAGTNVPQTIEYIKDAYEKFEPQLPINYFFLDNQLDNLYKKEEKQAELISAFTIISIIISIIGALGLIIFMCEYRVKEIGVRKINGASIFEVVNMLNMTFVKWVGLAFVIAAPVAYFLIDKWLQEFAYRTDMNWWVFVISGVLALLFSLSIITWISWRAARRNPVEALRYE